MGTQQFLYYVVATIAGIAVIIFMMSVMKEGQEGAVNATQIYRGKTRLFTAVEMIERGVAQMAKPVATKVRTMIWNFR